MIMRAIIIKSDSKSNLKILSNLAKKLGSNVLSIADEQFEDFAIGMIMDKKKSNENVSRESVIKKLKHK